VTEWDASRQHAPQSRQSTTGSQCAHAGWLRAVRAPSAFAGALWRQRVTAVPRPPSYAQAHVPQVSAAGPNANPSGCAGAAAGAVAIAATVSASAR
jgi:hypothetical protein